MSEFTDAFDAFVEDRLMWINDNAIDFFDGFRALLEAIYGAIDTTLTVIPYWAFILIALAAGWFFVGRLFAVAAAAGLWLCQAMGLWTETTNTLSLVLSSTFIALVIAIPLGIVVGLTTRLTKISDVILDFIQTMPPYIYLLPGIALLGYGPATAMCATTIVAIPPAMRLTAHGIRRTPTQFRELGEAIGMTPAQALVRIRIPFAFPAILAGVNQCVMLAFGMVVIAGIVGSGGLGETVYNAVQKLDIARSINAGIAIVVLSIVLDRFSQRLAALAYGGERG